MNKQIVDLTERIDKLNKIADFKEFKTQHDKLLKEINEALHQIEDMEKNIIGTKTPECNEGCDHNTFDQNIRDLDTLRVLIESATDIEEAMKIHETAMKKINQCDNYINNTKCNVVYVDRSK